MATTQCGCEEKSFAATAVYTGENRLVRVSGTCECPTPGFEVRLRVDDENASEPQRLRVWLEERPPSGRQPQVIAPAHVDQTFDIDQSVTEVELRSNDGRVFVLRIAEPS
jgi:hypothetical protein